MLLTFKYRIKDATTDKWLNAHARAVNGVWNYCGEVQEAARRHNKKWPSAFDLIRLTTGSAAMLGLHSDTVQAVCKQFVASRNAAHKRPRWRGKKSLGWVPFAAGRAIKIVGDTAIYLKRRYRFWNSRAVESTTIHCGSFAADARGRWYLNLQCKIEEQTDCGSGEVGIDLGLKTLAALSTGEKIPNLRIGRKHAAALARAQRAGRKKRARAINAKIERARKHQLHEVSMRLVRDNRLIVVGNVNAAGLAKTRMAKSVYDASWGALRHMLQYKAMAHGAIYVDADERWSSQACSGCGAIGGPKGLKALGVRSWICSDCGVLHDRDTNAALNILASGRNVALRQTEILAL